MNRQTNRVGSVLILLDTFGSVLSESVSPTTGLISPFPDIFYILKNLEFIGFNKEVPAAEPESFGII